MNNSNWNIINFIKTSNIDDMAQMLKTGKINNIDVSFFIFGSTHKNCVD